MASLPILGEHSEAASYVAMLLQIVAEYAWKDFSGRLSLKSLLWRIYRPCRLLDMKLRYLLAEAQVVALDFMW